MSELLVIEFALLSHFDPEIEFPGHHFFSAWISQLLDQTGILGNISSQDWSVNLLIGLIDIP